MSGPDPALPAPGRLLRLVLLGDSLAAGVGAARPSEGLAPRLGAELAARGLPVGISVVAVPGSTSLDLASQVSRALREGVDVALVVVGANDLLRGLPPVPSARALGAAVSSLRAAGARVLVVPVPDLSFLSRVPSAFKPSVAAACAGLAALQSDAILSGGGVPVPVSPGLVSRFATDRSLLSADRFHPSSAGYALAARFLAPRVVPVLTPCEAA